MSLGPGTRTGRFRLLEALYGDDEMEDIWSEESTVRGWLKVISALASAQAAAGLISEEEALLVVKACDLPEVDFEALWVESAVVGYPILPLIRQLSRRIPNPRENRIHFGATTQDIMDTALARQLTDSCSLLIRRSQAIGNQLELRAVANIDTLIAARTHGQQAVPTTLGLKLAVYLEEIRQCVSELIDVRRKVRTVSLYGAGGTSAAMGCYADATRDQLARSLGLESGGVPWHVARDRVLRFGQSCQILVQVCARLAREVIELSRTEIGEFSEGGGSYYGASSTMPQKANPIRSEAIVAFAALCSGEVGSLAHAMEVPHERGAGEWQIEWVAVPTIAEYAATAAALSESVLRKLELRPTRMLTNLELDAGLVMSEALMMSLARRVGRERAHEMVYEAAALARQSGRSLPDAFRALYPNQAVDAVDIPAPHQYVGAAGATVRKATREWRRLSEDVDHLITAWAEQNGGGAEA